MVATLVEIVQLAFEALQNIECITESGFCKRLCRRDRAGATATQQEHNIIAAHLRLQLPDESRVALQGGADQPGHMYALRNPPNELTLLRCPHIDQHGRV